MYIRLFRARERHPVAFRLYLKRRGPRLLVCGSASIYKASGRLLLSARPFFIAATPGLVAAVEKATTDISIVRVRGSVTESILCRRRRRAFYLLATPLRPSSSPPPSAPSFQRSSPFASPLRRLFALPPFPSLPFNRSSRSRHARSSAFFPLAIPPAVLSTLLFLLLLLPPASC